MSDCSFRKTMLLAVIISLLLILTACTRESNLSENKPKNDSSTKHEHHDHHEHDQKIPSDEIPSSLFFDHIHGLGFTGDGQRLLLAAHDGLRQFIDGVASRPPGALHDYMGFNVTIDGFYSSGHPAPGDELPNPLGVVSSTDFGKTVNVINLLGKTDLHVFGVGYRNISMYAYNEYPNDIMPNKAIYVSLDKGKTWRQAEASGFKGIPTFMSAHPEQPDIAVLINDQGQIYYTIDAAQSFKKIATNDIVTTASFSHDGGELIYSPLNQNTLKSIDSKTWKENEVVRTLALEIKRPILYLAQNPADLNTFAVATADHSVYMTNDNGVTWTVLAKKGATLNES